MTTTPDDARARLRSVLDLRQLMEPVWVIERRAREDLLRWCLWQVGIASGALVLLGAAFERIAAINSPVVGLTYVVAIVSFVAAIMTATWAHRWHVTLGQQRALAELQQVLMFSAAPDKDDYSGEADERLRRQHNDLRAFIESQKDVQKRVQSLMIRQDALLYGGLVALLLTVLGAGWSMALR